MLALIAVYRRLLAPLTWMLGARCRFDPSCSAYAEQAFRALDFPQACRVVVWRLLRCNPWCDGGPDPLRGTSDNTPSASLGRKPAPCDVPNSTPQSRVSGPPRIWGILRGAVDILQGDFPR